MEVPSCRRARCRSSFVLHEHIAFVGNSLAERMNLFGNFETLLHTRFPQLELVVRNFARPCDAVDDRQRPSNYTALDDPLKGVRPRHIYLFLRLQRSIRRHSGRTEVSRSVRKVSRRDGATLYARADGTAPRFVLISPIAWETDPGNPLWPKPPGSGSQVARHNLPAMRKSSRC